MVLFDHQTLKKGLQDHYWCVTTGQMTFVNATFIKICTQDFSANFLQDKMLPCANGKLAYLDFSRACFQIIIKHPVSNNSQTHCIKYLLNALYRIFIHPVCLCNWTPTVYHNLTMYY